MFDLIGELIAEVLGSLFKHMKSPFQGRSRSKKPRASKKMAPTLDGRPPHLETSGE